MTSLTPPLPGMIDRASATTLADLPEHGSARISDPHTSHDAADQADLRGAALRVMAAFRYLDQKGEGDVGLTDEDAEDVVDYLRKAGERMPSPSRLRTARKELERAGYVAPAGRHRKTRFNRDAEVYVLTEKGREWTP